MSTATLVAIVGLVLVQVAPVEMLGGLGVVEGFMSPVGYVNGVAVGVDGVDLVAKMGGRFRSDGPHQLVGGVGEMPAHFPAAGGDPVPGRMVGETAEKMFYFSKNQARPECCGSTYSASTGCVCTTTEQRDFLAERGGNAKAEAYPRA